MISDQEKSCAFRKGTAWDFFLCKFFINFQKNLLLFLIICSKMEESSNLMETLW